MKEKNLIRIFTLALVACLPMFNKASAQTYTGYLKLDDISVKAPDSILVTMTVPREAYVRDTVVLTRKQARELKKAGEYDPRPYYATPWMMGFKTNLLSDAIAIPYAGLEIQLARNLSLDLSGWFSPWNIFHPNPQTSIYGLAPELRWWYGSRAMSKGYFVGVHGNLGWYTLEWKDKEGNRVLYQNGNDDIYDPGTKYPAWSAGLTFGYSQPLDRKEHWNLEFYMGVGYSSYQQKCFYLDEDKKGDLDHEVHKDFGVTKVGINLTYRFSMRRVKASYYKNK